MVGKTWAVSLLAALAGVRAAPEPQTEAAPVVPGRYIVEFEDGQDGSAFIASIAQEAEKKMDLNYKLFRGASIKFHDREKSVETAARVAAMPAVKAIWPVRRYKIPDYTLHWVGNGDDDVTSSLAKRQEPGNDTFSPHVMTQVDKLRADGITGEGIKIAVIDTGVDYKHPDLGGCFGPGCLVTFGTDLVGDDFDGKNVPVPDPDPWDGCNGHGTHVSGIIAAQGKNPLGILGAAPGVTLGSYRVFGCSGDTPNDVLIAAYNQAFEAGADIITASIGGSSGWSEDPWAVVVSRIVEQGVPCTLSAGNSGDAGLFYASTAANGKRATAIASIDNTKSPMLQTRATYTVDGADAEPFGYTPGSPGNWTDLSLPLWALDFNITDPADGCDPFPADTPDLSGFVVLVRRGTCPFTQKATNAAAHGAKYVLYYNNAVGATAPDATGAPGIIAVGMVTAAQGEEWIEALAGGANITLHTTDPLTAGSDLTVTDNLVTGGFLSTFTSWGPTNEGDVYPQLAAPGGQILSLYPQPLGGYAVTSGTSMSCPITAAVYALIMEVRKTKNPQLIENLLAATANPNLWNDGRKTSPYLAPVAQQGAGLIQAYDAAHATTLLSVSGLAFNDSDHHVPKREFTISNEGTAPIDFKLSNVAAASAYTFADDDSIFPDTFPVQLVTSGASLSFSTGNSVTIPAGQRRIIAVSATPPADLIAKRLPVYSGYIAINGSDGTSLSLPYTGIVGSLHDTTVLDASTTYLSDSIRGSPPGAPPRAPANQTFTLPPPGHANDTVYANTTLPLIYFNLAFGSPLVRVDAVPISLCGNATGLVHEALGVKTLGQPAPFPMEYLGRDPVKSVWDGKLGGGLGEGGRYAPAGTYKLVVRALHIFGEDDDAKEYDVAETVPFKIKYVKDAPDSKRRRSR